jgi:hypothetical protein
LFKRLFVPAALFGFIRSDRTATEAPPDGESEYLILSDDRSRTVGGQDCKDLKDPSLKSFRGRVVKF